LSYFSPDILTQRIGLFLKGKSSAILFIFSALSILLLVLPVKLKKDASEIAFDFTYRPFYSLAERVEDLYKVHQRNEILSQKVIRLTLENAKLQEERLENERLRKMLEFKSGSSFRLIPAKVIAAEPGRLPTSVLINLGEKDGLKKGMPVVNLDGLVGKVSEVLVGTSRVQLLFHPQCRVAALDQRSRVQGIVKSKGGVILDFENVPVDEDVEPTDQIYTSGLGGIFPAGIKIGEVIKVDQKKDPIFKTIKLKPAVDFFRLEELFLIKL
jgi:rod shape-determining protein MreC